jgi:iron complex outermembrane recepter protein
MGKRSLLAGAALVGTYNVALLAPALRVARMKQQADAVSRLRFRLICSMALGCMLAGPALAQTDAPATPSTAPAVTAGTPSPSDTNSASQPLEEIVVTAQKRAENVQNVPLSIVAVSGQALAAQGITDVLALQRFIPDLRLDTIQQAAGVSLRIRGMGSYSNAAIDPDVAPYIDGVFIPRAGAILTSFLDVADVEVLRGPQGTLFGRNATVGAISINSNAPSFVRDSGSLTIDGGDYGQYKVEGIGNWALNDSFALRAAVFDSHTDGWFKNTYDGQTYGGSDTVAGRLSAKAAVSPSLTWTGRLDYAQTTGDGVNGSQPDVATLSPAQLAAFEATSQEPASALTGPSTTLNQRFDNPSLSDRQIGVSSDLGWEGYGGYSLRLIDSYRRWRNSQDDGDVFGTTLDLLNRFDTFSSDSQSHELQLLSPKDLLNGRLDFVAGLYYFEEIYKTTEVWDVGSQYCSFFYGGLGLSFLVPACEAAPQNDADDGIFNQRETSYAAYSQANFKIIPTVTLTLGARYTQDHKTGTFLQLVSNPYMGANALRAPESDVLSTADSHPTWRANLSWQITPDVMSFVSYSTGYKSGGFNNGGSLTALTAATRTFSPETSDDVELGLKSTFFQRRLLINADIFQTNLTNFQDRSYTSTGIVVRNAGDIRARGVELDSVIIPVEHFNISLGVAYLDSIYSSYPNAPGLPACKVAPPALPVAGVSCSTVQNLTGQTPQFSPKWQTDLALEYDTSAFANGWTAQVRGTLNYSSKIFTTDDDNPQSITGGNKLLGARLNFTSPDKTWNLALYGENLTNVKYFTSKIVEPLDSFFGVRNAATGTTLLRGYVGDPLTFGGRISKSF